MMELRMIGTIMMPPFDYLVHVIFTLVRRSPQYYNDAATCRSPGASLKNLRCTPSGELLSPPVAMPLFPVTLRNHRLTGSSAA
jgi:hypothetical protein